MKKARVSVIKDNITQGTIIPNFTNDCDVGQWADNLMENKGHVIDKNGLVDHPQYGIDNKTRRKGSKAAHTVGSMTINAIKEASKWEDTRYYHKTQNQNQITYDTDFLEVSSVKLVDMAIDTIQEKLAEGYYDCRDQIMANCRDKTIKSTNGWVILDGYGHHNSYRMRITDKAMKQIHNISGARDTFMKHFEKQ
jgi:hypothetical protein